jgi:hypothetical protein
MLAVIPLSVVGFLYYKQKEKEMTYGDVKQLESQFGEAIRGVDTALKAGYSVENAFIQSSKDMERQFGKNSFIHEELEAIRRGLVINITLEEMLTDLAKRSGSEAIEDFAKVFVIAKRYGGNMSEVISTSVETILLRIETEDEIKIELNNNNLIDEKILPEGDNESYEKNDTENNINEYEYKNKYKESINLPIMNLYDFCIHQFYFRCFGHSIKQNLINSCNDIVAKYLTIENILYNQIRLENLLKDYKWNNPNYEMNEKNDFLLELKEK